MPIATPMAFWLSSAVLTLAAVGAQAAELSTRALTLVVPYPPGASTDSLARTAAEALGRELGQSVIVENRPGGATTIATMAVKRAPADGHTLLFQTDGIVSGTYAVKNVGYRPEDFVAISPLARTPFALIAPSTIPSDSIDEYLAYARANPAKMNYGVLGSGLNTYKLLGDALSQSAGLQWTEIPYKGGMEGVQATMAGQIQAYFATVSLAAAQRHQPTLRVLAVTDTQRSRYLPDVPTFAESGHPDVVGASLFGLAVRADTPPVLQQRLKDGMRKVMATPEMRKAVGTLSLELYEGSLEEYQQDIDKVARHYAKEARRMGMETAP